MSELLINKKVFHQIENDLGKVTDFSITETEDGVEIGYKSNGVPKKIYNTDKSNKHLIQCFIYCASAFSHKPIINIPVIQ